jgi:hypothetical protein
MTPAGAVYLTCDACCEGCTSVHFSFATGEPATRQVIRLISAAVLPSVSTLVLLVPDHVRPRMSAAYISGRGASSSSLARSSGSVRTLRSHSSGTLVA